MRRKKVWEKEKRAVGVRKKSKKDQEKHMGSVQVEFKKVSKRSVATSLYQFTGQNHTFQIYRYGI